MTAFDPYAPLNEPKRFAEGVWIVDGPEIRMTYGPIKLPFPTRMTIVRLTGGGLWIHSPIAPDEGLFEAVDSLGEVQHLIAPNSIHYWYMADWIERYPQATTYAVPDLAETAKRPFRIDHRLELDAGFDWQDEVDFLLVPGTMVSEAVFFVQGGNVLILTDLIENFEPKRVHNPLLRWLIRLAGADGGAPYDLRMTFRPKMKLVREQVGRMLEWPVERIVMAHGKPVEEDARAMLGRSFKWARPEVKM